MVQGAAGSKKCLCFDTDGQAVLNMAIPGMPWCNRAVASCCMSGGDVTGTIFLPAPARLPISSACIPSSGRACSG